MRIAYIAPYQGPTLLSRRPIVRNLGLAANVKMELVSELLRGQGHELELISQGAVVEEQAKLFPGFREPKPFSPAIPVFYASALPVRRLNGLWSAMQTLRLFRQRHRVKPFDAVIAYNLQFPQALCARYAMSHLRVPVVLEYEDDALIDVLGVPYEGWNEALFRRFAKGIMSSVSACTGVSPHLLSEVPDTVPKMLLRGVVSNEILRICSQDSAERPNWVVFSGTHFRTKGLEQLVDAWEMLKLPGWELHIAGHGEKTDFLMNRTHHDKSVVYHGLLNREENATLLNMAKIGMNPHELSAVPGNVFAFKIVEYLAAGNHVISTRMGPLEPELEAGITYIPDNTAQTIATAIRQVIDEGRYHMKAKVAAERVYGPAAVARSLHELVEQAALGGAKQLSSMRAAIGS